MITLSDAPTFAASTGCGWLNAVPEGKMPIGKVLLAAKMKTPLLFSCKMNLSL